MKRNIKKLLKKTAIGKVTAIKPTEDGGGFVVSGFILPPVKVLKTYVVPVRSHVSSDYIIAANSKDEAYRLVAEKMKKSMKAQLDNMVPHPQLENTDGYTEVMKSMIKIRS